VFVGAGNQFATSLLAETRFCKAGTCVFAGNPYRANVENRVSS